MDGVIYVDKLNEKKILIQIIGVLVAISNDSMTIGEGEKYLFSPRMVKKLIDEKCDNRIVDIINEGCELEDIESLIPDKLEKNLDYLEKKALDILKSYEVIDNINWS